jgi:hypothetical protein
MITVLAIDALEYSLVEEFNCKNLKQKFYGKTDISEYSEARTMVLWSSFMTGKNMEKEILSKGDKEMWNTEIDIKDTFFSKFDKVKIIDLPGFNYDRGQHYKERKLLKKFFDTGDENEKRYIRSEYNNMAFEYHKKIKQEFGKALNGKYDFVLGYFSIADVVGHLNFGNKTMMKIIYEDLDDIAKNIKNNYTVLSDHGMEKIGIFGDHSRHGFWSTNLRDLGNPKITDFAHIISQLR